MFNSQMSKILEEQMVHAWNVDTGLKHKLMKQSGLWDVQDKGSPLITSLEHPRSPT